MVASSRSSVRRPASRGNQNTSRLDSATEETSQSSARDESRVKRTRLASISDKEQQPQQQKRRKLVESPNRDRVRIPLRGRGLTHGEAVPAAVTRAIPALSTVTQTSSSTSSPLDSPSLQPQYDQIKRIEEKARAAIQNESANPGKKDDRRRLRSEHGGSRAKTELAQYFPTFDDMLSLEPPKRDVLTPKARLVLVDDIPDYEPPQGQPDPFGADKPLHNIVLLESGFALPSSRHIAHDPLGPDFYYKAHRKAERHEKQMKNGDKERAQHEKYQLDRLLEELRGPDWLKTLGITGITDTEKKRYEPKRELFIRETRALIGKFKRWKEEEKRRKLEKEQALLEEMDAEETEAAASTSTRRTKKRVNGRAQSKAQSAASSEHGPDPSEIDLLAAQQLLQEAKSASTRRKKGVGPPEPSAPPLPAPPEVHTPFTSFFEKRHLRDAAVAGRQRGRTILAFGEPIPEIREEDFELPHSILTEDAIRASQRNRRRARRSIDD